MVDLLLLLGSFEQLLLVLGADEELSEADADDPSVRILLGVELDQNVKILLLLDVQVDVVEFVVDGDDGFDGEGVMSVAAALNAIDY